VDNIKMDFREIGWGAVKEIIMVYSKGHMKYYTVCKIQFINI
jgi:hypothetical protein